MGCGLDVSCRHALALLGFLTGQANFYPIWNFTQYDGRHCKRTLPAQNFGDIQKAPCYMAFGYSSTWVDIRWLVS